MDVSLQAATALMPKPGNREILAIAGPPGAGKSTLAKRLVLSLCQQFGPDSAAYVPLDGFHLSNAQLKRQGTADRKGAIFTFDVHGYLALLRRLVAEVSTDVYVPDYDRRLHEPIAARHVVTGKARLIITEGNYLANPAEGWCEIAELAGELWYLDIPDEVRQRRLLTRHWSGTGDPTPANNRIRQNDTPNAELVKADRSRCTRVVDG